MSDVIIPRKKIREEGICLSYKSNELDELLSEFYWADDNFMETYARLAIGKCNLREDIYFEGLFLCFNSYDKKIDLSEEVFYLPPNKNIYCRFIHEQHDVSSDLGHTSLLVIFKELKRCFLVDGVNSGISVKYDQVKYEKMFFDILTRFGWKKEKDTMLKSVSKINTRSDDDNKDKWVTEYILVKTGDEIAICPFVAMEALEHVCRGRCNFSDMEESGTYQVKLARQNVHKRFKARLIEHLKGFLNSGTKMKQETHNYLIECYNDLVSSNETKSNEPLKKKRKVVS